jgi:hypothetical protein
LKLATLGLAGLAALVCASVALAVPNTKSAISDPGLVKGSGTTVPAPIHIDQAGDTIASATPIVVLPFHDTGTTAGYVDNYAPNCGFPNGAPDVVYSLSPTTSQSLTIALCGSAYDTEVYVYEDTEGNIIACNDDSCGLQSRVVINVSTGHTYYIIVDGYYNYSGSYVIDVTPPCQVTCPAGAMLEGEPQCGDNYYDSFNGGCNSVPPVFEALPFFHNVTVCGQYGGFFYAGLSYRDTDWYEVHVPSAQNITWTVNGESDTLCGIINGNFGCPVTSFYAYAYGGACVPHTASAFVSAGTWWLWAGTLNFGSTAGPCTQDYVGVFDCSAADCHFIAVEPTTWGGLKNMYK